MVRNILFVMCDQLRADYLGCEGHPCLETPHIDNLAARGVRFTRAYVQSPVCGPSRMSFYTGRYVTSHGATWNNMPLRIDELTLGDYLRERGLQVVLIGKSHVEPNRAGLERLGLDPERGRGRLVAEGGFEPYFRDDGLYPVAMRTDRSAYNAYLRSKGYESPNPWHDFANSAEGPDGEVLSGYRMRYARLPARIREEDSETAYTAARALDFLAERGDRPWLMHLSFIKPHWPYVAPAPYHSAYGPDHCSPVLRDARERENPHPVYAAYMRRDESTSFSRDEVRRTVVPAYMGLIKQIDDHVGRVLRALDERGLSEHTMIVFTSDHGDYLGDHWLGDKELFHEPSARVPLIMVDPEASADATRGQTVDALVEGIDLLPTFVAAAGGEAPEHIVEGRSLLPLIRGGAEARRAAREQWRDAAFSELDYCLRQQRVDLGLTPRESRATMIRTAGWKFVLHERFAPQLFDLDNDPVELVDLGEDPGYASERAELSDRIFAWLRCRNRRVTISDQAIEQGTEAWRELGLVAGQW